MKMSSALRRELRKVTHDREDMREQLRRLEKSMPARPIDPETGRPGEYRSHPYRMADRAIQLCRQALGCQGR